MRVTCAGTSDTAVRVVLFAYCVLQNRKKKLGRRWYCAANAQRRRNASAQASEYRVHFSGISGTDVGTARISRGGWVPTPGNLATDTYTILKLLCAEAAPVPTMLTARTASRYVVPTLRCGTVNEVRACFEESTHVPPLSEY